MHLPSLNAFSPSKLAGDVISFFSSFSVASSESPMLGTVKTTLLEVAPQISPDVMDEVVRAGAALVVSFLSRVLFDMWERIKDRREERKNRKSKIQDNAKEKKDNDA